MTCIQDGKTRIVESISNESKRVRVKSNFTDISEWRRWLLRAYMPEISATKNENEMLMTSISRCWRVRFGAIATQVLNEVGKA